MPVINQKSPELRNQTVVDGAMTPEQYQQTPWNELNSMEFLFSSDVRLALANGVITFEQFLQIPWNERDSMKYFFSSAGRQAVLDGVITLEQYLKIPRYERDSMESLFSSDVQQAVATGIITLERYLQVPRYDRSTMRYLFSPDGRQALADGIITLDQYLEIPWNERDTMEYLFLPAGRQAVVEGVITLEQFLQIPWNKRSTMHYLFSANGRLAVADGIITLERYLQIPPFEHYTLASLFSPDGRLAIAEGVITLERYLQIPLEERCNTESLFSSNGRQAVADHVITLEQYLQLPWEERDSMEPLFSPDGRLAVADGVITLEQYLQIPRPGRITMLFLFSPNGRLALAEGIITLERYLQIPLYERQNVMAALRDPHTRQRIINGQITIENIVGIPHPAYGVAALNMNGMNGTQNTHTSSVHESASESAKHLLNCYQSKIDGAGLKRTIEKARAYISGLDDSLKNNAAQRAFSRLVAADDTFTDTGSQITTRQLVALAFLVTQDDEKRISSLDDATMQFVEALYEIQRGYNLSELGIDQGGQDRYICAAGAFNKLIEKLQGIHPECQILYLTKETASLKVPRVVREEALHYLTTLAKTHTAEAPATFTRLIAEIEKEGVEIIWDHIKDIIAKRLFDEFGSLYQDETEPDFIALVDAGKCVELDNLSTFQEQARGNDLSQHRLDSSEAQEEALINPETLIYPQIDQQLNRLENKAKNLHDRGHILASSKANQLIQLMRDLNHDYFTEKKIDANTYKEKSLAAINQKRPELDKHRGYKQILGNLLISTASLGTGQLLNKVCRGHFLFFKKTGASKEIDTLIQVIEKIDSPVRGTSISVLLDTSSASIAPVPR